MCRTMLKQRVYKATITIQDSIGSLYDECRRGRAYHLQQRLKKCKREKTLKRDLNRLYLHDGHEISLLMLVLMKGHKECAKLLIKYNIDCGLEDEVCDNIMHYIVSEWSGSNQEVRDTCKYLMRVVKRRCPQTIVQGSPTPIEHAMNGDDRTLKQQLMTNDALIYLLNKKHKL